MRTFTICCIAIALHLQLGCASIPSNSKLSSHRKLKPDPQASANYIKARDLERQGKFERARELLEQMVEKDPENSQYMHRLAVICTRLQRYGEADDYFDRAYKLAPKDASLVADRGYSHYVRGDLDQAERLLRDAVHMKPSDKRAVSNLALVVGVRGNVDESLKLLLEVNDRPTALTHVAYIHGQRGEYDLAERRFREALAIDEKHKDATKGLAELSKLRPQQNISVAESSVMEREAFKPFDAEFSRDRTSAVRQVSAVNESENRIVVTANFVEEASESKEPGLLDADQQSNARPTKSQVVTAKFEEDDAMADDGGDDQQPSAARKEIAPNDDWDADVSQATRSPKTRSTPNTSREPIDFDWASDDAKYGEESDAAPPTRERMKFVPSGSRLKTRPRYDSNHEN